MPAPDLAEVEQAAQSLAEAILGATASQETIWQVTGPATAGKSTCLQRTSELLQAAGFPAVVVSPPANQLDAGAVALSQLAVGMADLGLVNGELRTWTEQPGTWRQRSAQVARWVRENPELVVLCDEPRSWGGHRETEDRFAARGWEAAYLIGSLPVRRVCSGANLPVPLQPIEQFSLHRQSPDTTWLTDAGEWGALTPVATALAGSSLLTPGWTPLQLRLLVASAAASSVEAVERWHRDSTTELVQFAGETLRLSPRLRDAWEMWLRLAPTREALDAETVARLTPAQIAPEANEVVHRCLLYENELGLQLHDVLKLHAARAQRADPSVADQTRAYTLESSRELFQIYTERFARASEDGGPRAILDSLEAFHFASASGDPQLFNTAVPAFVDQLDALGWRLSYEHRKFDQAADAFRAALRWDPTDDYAHHYLAFNLERDGNRSGEIEAHYRRATELNDANTWWWSRLVSHLVSRGRLTEARTTWTEAELALNVESPDSSPELYESLHCWVAGACLASGEPRFARNLLDQVPDWIRPQIASFGELDQRANALLQVGEGPAVVPGWRLSASWWAEGPELLQPRLGSGQRLVKWLAARVERVDEQGVRLRAALVASADTPPQIVWTTITREVFDEACRDNVRARDLEPGRFIEVGLFASSDADDDVGAVTLIRVLPQRLWHHGVLSVGPELRALILPE